MKTAWRVALLFLKNKPVFTPKKSWDESQNTNAEAKVEKEKPLVLNFEDIEESEVEDVEIKHMNVWSYPRSAFITNLYKFTPVGYATSIE